MTAGPCVVFRADASFTMGTGHVMRCLTLASDLRARGATALFVCREHAGHLTDVVREQGFTVFSLPAPDSGFVGDAVPAYAAWLGCSWQEDADQTSAVILGTGAMVDWLVVDHYALDDRWESALRPSTECIMAIDDLADRPHDCDLLLDQNLVAQMHSRYSGEVSSACTMLLGPKYALLQPAYSELHDQIPPKEGPVKRILIFFGGADRADLTGRSLSAFLKLDRQDIEVDVVLSRDCPTAGMIHELAEGHRNVHVHVGLPSLAPLMAKADLAIGAGGATSWERLCLGLPSLVITLADNQTPVAEELHRLHLVNWLGHQDQVTNADLVDVLRDVTTREVDPDWSKRCKSSVDGRGTERTVDAMSNCFGMATGPAVGLQFQRQRVRSKPMVVLKAVRPSDWARLLSWRNDPVTQSAFVQTHSVTQGEHVEWLGKTLASDDRALFIAIDMQSSAQVGTCRLDLRRPKGEEPTTCDISITVDPRQRGRGYAAPMIEGVLSAAPSKWGARRVVATIRVGNEASLRAFGTCGFSLVSNNNEFVTLERFL